VKRRVVFTKDATDDEIYWTMCRMAEELRREWEEKHGSRSPGDQARLAHEPPKGTGSHHPKPIDGE
jgi:hypothetical protein